jgi:hypothetical protein
MEGVVHAIVLCGLQKAGRVTIEPSRLSSFTRLDASSDNQRSLLLEHFVRLPKLWVPDHDVPEHSRDSILQPSAYYTLLND